MRNAACAILVAAGLAGQAGALAAPPTHERSLASIEIENVTPDLGDAPVNRESASPELSAPGNPLWAIPVSKLSATRDRPLFSASRRPRAPVVAAAPSPSPSAPPAAPPAPPFSLVGTIIGENSRFAIFLDQASKTATGIKEGASVSGWTVRSIDPRSTVVEGSGRTVTLDLPEPKGQTASAPAVTQAPRKGRFAHDAPDRL
jgi:hypothetical protein